jgi:predicted dithiol-disulfide oxidoreductase (DUF899 family)
MTEPLKDQKIVSEEEWVEARKALLKKEKEFTAVHYLTFWADNFNGIIVHLNQRDVTMIAVSRAPYSKLAAYQK